MAASIDKKLKTMSNRNNISNLPNHILQEIFSKLPIASLLDCRKVCKLWLSILSDANQFFAVPEPTNLLLYGEEKRSSPGFNFYWYELKETCDHEQYYRNTTVSWGTRILSDFKFVNSCKGLICVCESHSLVWFRTIIRIVNPVTAEFITLPSLEEDFGSDVNMCALGFSSKSNQFKAVRIYHDFGNPSIDRFILEAQVYTLGMDRNIRGWRSIGVVPQYDSEEKMYLWLSFNAFVCGSFHWLLKKSPDDSTPIRIVSFDFDTEQFRHIPLPPIHADVYESMDIGVFGQSSIYFSHGTIPSGLEVWQMNEYGVAESWIKRLVLQMNLRYHVWLGRPWFVLKFFENGDLLLSCRGDLWLHIVEKKIFIRYQTSRTERSSRIHTLVVNTLNFASLKDILAEDRS